MGIYLNPGNKSFKESIDRKTYVDKSLLIEKLWNNAKEKNKYICISRPRRFGKSTDANMLAAYFSKGCSSVEIFSGLNISEWGEYGKHLNHYNVIYLNMQDFLSRTHDVLKMNEQIALKVIKDLRREFPDFCDDEDLSEVLGEIFAATGESFIFVIDEWDCVFREFKENKEAQEAYLDYLRLVFKDKPYVEFAYMTGILPIKKYGTHSALNMFDEISMLDAKDYSEYMGLTEKEVEDLCRKFGADYGKMREWYDGYHMRGDIYTYSPRSVTAAINNHDFDNYWSQTETYEALKVYIDLNYDGLKDAVVEMLAGRKVRIDTRSFQNDMSSLSTRDDVLTLLVHLGYLGYVYGSKEVYVPNNEVKDIFITSIQNSSWNCITEMFKNSSDLLLATWNMQSERVAEYIQNSHYETSILQYNDENALSYTVSLAYITAKEYYTIVRELPAGKGFADMAFIPKGDKPAMIVELKYDKSADSGISQIRDKRYFLGLDAYLDNLLLVSIGYDKDTKEHECVIEKY